VRARRQRGAEGKQRREVVAVDKREEESETAGGWIGLSGNHQGRFRENTGPTTIL
jgi:hypothetical protein